MSIKSRIIKKLEKDVEYSAGHIDIEHLPEEESEKLFKQFGEGDDFTESTFDDPDYHKKFLR